METPEKEYKNKDLIVSEHKFSQDVDGSFTGSDFEDKLEWAMLMIQMKFQNIKFGNHLKQIYASSFDKAYLFPDIDEGTLNDNMKFFKHFSGMQASPSIFPNLNIKVFILSDTICLRKVKELDLKSKRSLYCTKKYLFEVTNAFFKKDTESFYGRVDGYECGDSFFRLGELGDKISKSDIPTPIPLTPGYVFPENAIKLLSKEEILDYCSLIAFSYQVAMSMYYEWNIYIKEYDNIGITIPIEPSILSEVYKTSMLKFEDKKRMIHFVKDHYRRKVANPKEDYSVYVQKYLRGENKFNYKGFIAEIIPPKYDLNRIKTKKKFVDPLT